MKQIVIIGGGLSGTLTAMQLMMKARDALTIHLVEKKVSRMGRGIAYASEFKHQLLNVPVGKMSLFTDRPNDFYNYLILNKRHYGNLPENIAPQSFVPRNIFGDYVNERYDEISGNKNNSCTLIFHHAEAMDIINSESTDLTEVILKDGTILTASSVVICTGNVPATLPFPIKINQRHEANFISNPWEIIKANRIDRFSDVILIGSGLTMLDWLIQLEKQNHCGRIYAISRNGFLPQPYSNKFNGAADILKEVRFQSISEIIRFIRQKKTEKNTEEAGWQRVIDSFRNHTPGIWQNLPLKEKQRFLRHAKSLWEIHRHRMPQEIADVVKWMTVKDQLRIIAGRIYRIESNETRFSVTYRDKKLQQPNELIADVVINCTGPEMNPGKTESILFKNLFGRGLTKADDNGLGIQTTLEGRVIGCEKPIPLYALGSLRKGTLWESTSAPEIREQVESLVDTLLANDIHNNLIQAFENNLLKAQLSIA